MIPIYLQLTQSHYLMEEYVLSTSHVKQLMVCQSPFKNIIFEDQLDRADARRILKDGGVCLESGVGVHFANFRKHSVVSNLRGIDRLISNRTSSSRTVAYALISKKLLKMLHGENVFIIKESKNWAIAKFGETSLLNPQFFDVVLQADFAYEKASSHAEHPYLPHLTISYISPTRNADKPEEFAGLWHKQLKGKLMPYSLAERKEAFPELFRRLRDYLPPEEG